MYLTAHTNLLVWHLLVEDAITHQQIRVTFFVIYIERTHVL